MIPTMLLFGLVVGRWWKTCLVVGTLGWPLLLWFDNIIESPNEFLGAAGLAALNTAVGVASTSPCSIYSDGYTRTVGRRTTQPPESLSCRQERGPTVAGRGPHSCPIGWDRGAAERRSGATWRSSRFR